MANRLSRYSLVLALFMGLTVISAYAQAPQWERVALHPCVIADASEVEVICATAAIWETMNLVPSTEVRTYLDEKEWAHAPSSRTATRASAVLPLPPRRPASSTSPSTPSPPSPPASLAS